jgi:hypothetical protein
MYSSTLSLTLALDGGWVVNVMPLLLYCQERPSTHSIGLGGDHSQSGWVEKTLDPPGSDPQTVQPIASHTFKGSNG